MCPDPSLCCSRCLQAAKLVLAQPRITDEQCEAMFKELIDEEACGKDVGYVEPDVEREYNNFLLRATTHGYPDLSFSYSPQPRPSASSLPALSALAAPASSANYF